MPRITLPLADGFYETDSLPVSSQNCVNLLPVLEDADALVMETLREAPGVTLVFPDPNVPFFDPLAPPDPDSPADPGGPTPPNPGAVPLIPDAPKPDLDEDGDPGDGDRPTFPSPQLPECVPFSCNAIKAAIPSWAYLIFADEPAAYSDVFPLPTSTPLHFYGDLPSYFAGTEATAFSGTLHGPTPIGLLDAVGIEPPIDVCDPVDPYVLRRLDTPPGGLYGYADISAMPSQGAFQVLTATGARGVGVAQEGTVLRVVTRASIERVSDGLTSVSAHSIDVRWTQSRGASGSLEIETAISPANFDESDSHSTSGRTESQAFVNSNLLGDTWILWDVVVELGGIREIPDPAGFTRWAQDYSIICKARYKDASGDWTTSTVTMSGATAISNARGTDGILDFTVEGIECWPQILFESSCLIAGIDFAVNAVGATPSHDLSELALLWDRNGKNYTPPSYC